MSRSSITSAFQAGTASVQVFDSAEALGQSAAQKAAAVLERVIRNRGSARVIGATGNSQIPFVEALVEMSIDWSAVDLFHMDEYVGLAADHPASFRRWIRERIAEKVHPRNTHHLDGDARDLEAEMNRYTRLLLESPVDLAFVGFGENGHIAFNDPPVADFRDPLTVKKVVLDAACRQQQAGEGHFKDVASVPREALTITCPGLFHAETWICCVPERRKAEAVRNALEGPVAESCPASLVRRHPNANVFLDRESASLLATAGRG